MFIEIHNFCTLFGADLDAKEEEIILFAASYTEWREKWE
jgi:hypothetical protein